MADLYSADDACYCRYHPFSEVWEEQGGGADFLHHQLLYSKCLGRVVVWGNGRAGYDSELSCAFLPFCFANRIYTKEKSVGICFRAIHFTDYLFQYLVYDSGAWGARPLRSGIYDQ